MNESDLIKVLQELKVYSQTWKSVSSQDFACQTDFEEVDDNNNNVVPIIYCSQLSLDGDAETQCNIPLTRVICKSCAKPIRVEDASTQCDFTLSPEEEYNASFQKNNQRFNRPIKREKDDDYSTVQVSSFPILHELNQGEENTLSYSDQPDHFPVPVKKEICTSKRIESKNDQNGKPCGSTSSRIEVESNKIMEDFDDHPHDDDAFEDDDPDDEAALREKYGLAEKSEEDKLFWAEMKEKSKHIKANSKKKKKKNLHAESPVSEKDCSNELQKEIITNKNIKIENEITEREDNEWITDDEEEEDDLLHDFTSEFKEEWRKKRVPANTHEKNFVCDVCDKPYSKSHYLRDHIVRDHSDHEKAKEYPFRCSHCRRVYNGQKQLDHHQSLHSGPCEICGMMFGCNGLFWNHRKNHDAVCDICNKSFSSVSSLSTHKKMKHGSKRFFCDICDKGYIYQSLLKMHTEKAHSWRSDEKQASSSRESFIRQCVKGELMDLNCDECSYVAKNEQSLKVHQGMAHRRKRKKTGKKPYCCPICNAELTTNAILKKHVDKHLGPYPTHKCSACNKMYATRKKLESHRRKVHGLVNDNEETQELHIIAEDQDIYPCRSCDTTFVTAYALQDHMFSMHGEPKKIEIISQDQIFYECAYCSSSFESNIALKTHILSVHGVSHSVSREIVHVASDSLHVTNAGEEFPVMEINLSNRPSGSPESRVMSETFEIPVETPGGHSDTRTTVSLPACAVPANVSMVEIDGVQYHVIRNGQ